MIESNFVQDISALKKLPKTWKVLDFTDVISDISGGNKKFLKSDFLEEGKIPVVDQGKDLIAGYVNEESAIVKGMPPYIVFGDHTRILKFIDFPFVMGADGTKVLKVKKLDLNSERYLFHYLKSLSIPETGYNRHYKYLKAIKIPLPTLPQQQKIANILDASDDLRQKDKAILAKYDELTQALFLDMFGDPVSNPKGWKVKKGKEYCIKISVGVVIKPASYYTENGVIALRAMNIKPNKIVNNGFVYFSQHDHENTLSKSIVYLNDVLIVRTGSTGTATVVTIEYDGCNCIDSIIVKPNHQIINSHYLAHFFNSERGKELVSKNEVGGIQKHFNIGTLNHLEIPIPQIDIQNQFAERVQVIEQQKAIAQKSLEKSEALFNSLLQKAFKGELV
jgi:type I restriction enzyme S subunit